MDKPDLTKIFNALPVSREVFACWFLLQHCYAYRPFITKANFTKEFEGDIRISLLEVEEEQQQAKNCKKRYNNKQKKMLNAA